MSLFFGRTEKRSMDDWGTGGWSSRSISESRATYLGPVFAAIRHIVDYGSTLPVDFYRKVDEKTRVPVGVPRLFARLNEPGGIGVETWIGQFLYSIAINGNAVGWASDFDGWGYPLSVTWLDRSEWAWNKASSRWHVFGAPVPFYNVVHMPWLVPAGERLGLSPVGHYKSIVAAGLSAQEYADMKRGGGLPPLDLANTEIKIDPLVGDAISDRLSARLALGKPFVHGKDWNLTAPTIPPNHAQFIETLKMTANQIAAIYGIDPTEVGGEAANSLTYSTEELRQIRRAADLRPYLVRFERCINRILPNQQYMQFNIDANMRVDIKTRTEVQGARIADGRLSVDEARAQEDMAPVKGGSFHNVPAPKTDLVTREGDSL